jgi:hypothetical protein
MICVTPGGSLVVVQSMGACLTSFIRDPRRSYLQEIPEPARHTYTFWDLNHRSQTYPLYLIEDSEGLCFMTEEDAIDDIKEPTADDDDCSLTIYRFDRDYRPEVAGADEMGTINHAHVDNEDLARIKSEGRNGLLWFFE